MPNEPFGDCILPSDNYGAHISDAIKEKLNIPQNGKTPLIFASSHITKAMAFGLQGSLQEKILCTSIEGSPNELVLACDRAKMLSRVRNVTIYETSSQGFVDLDYAQRQCVSPKPIPFSNAKVAFKAKSAADLMKGGLQIIAFDEPLERLDNKLLNTLIKGKDDDFYKMLGTLLRNKKLVWQNLESGIGLDKVLADKLNVSRHVQKQNSFSHSTRPGSKTLQ